MFNRECEIFGSETQEMNINIQYPEITVQVEVSPRDAVKDIKEKLHYFSDENECLSYNGVLLSDDGVLSDIGIQDGAVITVVPKDQKHSLTVHPGTLGILLSSGRNFHFSGELPPSGADKSLVSGVSQSPKRSSLWVQYIGRALPSILLSSGLVIAATLISGSLLLSAAILSDRMDGLLLRDDLKTVKEEILEGVLGSLQSAQSEYRNAKSYLNDIYLQAARVSCFSGFAKQLS